jgi:hypothetical protein
MYSQRVMHAEDGWLSWLHFIIKYLKNIPSLNFN